MKIKITQTIEIDKAAWALEFGLTPYSDKRDPSGEAMRWRVRQDVEKYFEGWLQGHIKCLGLESKCKS